MVVVGVPATEKLVLKIALLSLLGLLKRLVVDVMNVVVGSTDVHVPVMSLD